MANALVQSLPVHFAHAAARLLARGNRNVLPVQQLLLHTLLIGRSERRWPILSAMADQRLNGRDAQLGCLLYNRVKLSVLAHGDGQKQRHARFTASVHRRGIN